MKRVQLNNNVKGDNIMSKVKPFAIRHGELFIQPVDKLPEGKKEAHNSFVVGHSETGHHHILESDQKFDIVKGAEIYFELLAKGKVVHQKTKIGRASCRERV